jgi:hypothetical protein
LTRASANKVAASPILIPDGSSLILFNFIFTEKKCGGHFFGKYPQTIRFDLREIYSRLKTFGSRLSYDVAGRLESN